MPSKHELKILADLRALPGFLQEQYCDQIRRAAFRIANNNRSSGLSFGKRLKSHCIENNITQTALASAVGMTTGMINHLWNDRREPSLGTIRAIFNHLWSTSPSQSDDEFQRIAGIFLL